MIDDEYATPICQFSPKVLPSFPSFICSQFTNQYSYIFWMAKKKLSIPGELVRPETSSLFTKCVFCI